MLRLRTRAEFQAVMAGGTVARTAHFALHRLALAAPGVPVADGCWIGALLPKRWARRAVTRNAIRRQIYAVSTALEPQLPRAALVVRLRAAFDRAQFTSASSRALKQAVRAELERLFGQTLVVRT